MFDVGYNFFLENTFQHNFIRLLSTANIHYYSIKYRSNCCIKYRSNWILNDNTYKAYRWHFLRVLSDIIISELLYLCRFDMLILLPEMRCYLLPCISFRRIIVRVDEFVPAYGICTGCCTRAYSQFASAREFRDQRGEQGVLRAKECSPYTCPSVHQSFSELQED